LKKTPITKTLANTAIIKNLESNALYSSKDGGLFVVEAHKPAAIIKITATCPKKT
jgi:hypothetical protein